MEEKLLGEKNHQFKDSRDNYPHLKIENDQILKELEKNLSRLDRRLQ